MGINRRVFDKGLQQIYGIGGNSQFIKSTQEVAASANFSGTSNNTSITSVESDNCLMIVGCHNNTTTGNKQGYKNLCNVQLSDTQITLTKNSSTAGSYSYIVQIIEFFPEIVVSNQFINVTGASSNGYEDRTITAISTSNALITSHHGLYTSDTNNYTYFPTYTEITSTTNLRIANGYTGAIPSTNIRGQVLELVIS